MKDQRLLDYVSGELFLRYMSSTVPQTESSTKLYAEKAIKHAQIFIKTLQTKLPERT